MKKENKLEVAVLVKCLKSSINIQVTFFAAKVSQSYISENFKDTEKGVSFKHEVEIHSSSSHPSIVNFIGYSPINFDQDFFPVIVIEYLKNDSLEQLLKIERAGFDIPFWNNTMRLINLYGIAVSMQFLHSKNRIHRDLKPDNIILDKFLFPKLTGFGFAIPISSLHQMNNEIVGTPAFIAPETYNQNIYSKSIDVYAFGMLVYEVMSKKMPFDGISKYLIILYASKNENFPQLDDQIPQKYRDLIEACWSFDPKKRPTFDYIVEDLKNNPEYIMKDVDEKMFAEYI